MPALAVYHFGQLAPPGSYGEELGWRGYLVRRLREARCSTSPGNEWNPFFLGDPYGDGEGLFGGAKWVFNGEGLFGMGLNLAIGVVLFARLLASRARLSQAPVWSAPA